MVKEENETKVKNEENSTNTATLEKNQSKKYTAKSDKMKSKISDLKSELEEKNSSKEIKNKIKESEEIKTKETVQKEKNKEETKIEPKKEQIKNDITENTKQTGFKQVKQEPKKTSKSSIWFITIFLVIFLFAIFAIFSGFTIYNYKNSDKISKGVYINNIDISNLTIDEAKSKIQNYYQDKLSNDITFVHNDYTAYLKTSEIELTYDIDSAVNYAFKIGKTHNIFKDNYEIFNAMINGINVTPTYTYNKEALKKILTNLSAELPDAVVESGYYIEGNNLIITKGKDGYIIDPVSTSSALENLFTNLSQVNTVIELTTIIKAPDEVDIEKIYNEVHKDAQDAYYTTEPHAVYPAANGIDFDVSIEEAQNIVKTSGEECIIPLKVLRPSVTTNMLGQEAFPDLLSKFTTKYDASNTNRTTNLRLAANKINGYVLLPGETFSYNNVVGERTIAAGYRDAAIYQNGEVVQGLGGGICQISTTLYNAALFSNLEIVELYNHQFVPSYVGAGRDATVVYGVKDFKFKNTRNHAIKITCSVSGGVATFNIWGYKEDTEYDVSVYASVTSRTDSYIKSSTYRTLKLNGQVVKSENIINSTYKVH